MAASAAKRKRGTPVTAWITREQEALIRDRCAELGVDRSTLLRAGLWLCILQPAVAKMWLGVEKDDAATSLLPSGCRPNLTTLFSNWRKSQALAGRTCSERPSPSFAVSPETTRNFVTHASEGIFSDVGGWHTLQRTNRPKRRQDQDLSVRSAKLPVLQRGRSQLLRPFQKPPSRTGSHASERGRHRLRIWSPSTGSGLVCPLQTSHKLLSVKSYNGSRTGGVGNG